MEQSRTDPNDVDHVEGSGSRNGNRRSSENSDIDDEERICKQVLILS